VQSPLGPQGPSRRHRAGGEGFIAPLQQTFHYAVPPVLRDHVLPGHLVWVPFGARELPGIVLALSRSSPVTEVRDILDVVDARPVLTPYQIDLARWISDYYRTPLYLVAWGMFPPGISWQPEILVYLVGGAESGESLKPEERALIELLQQSPGMPLVQLGRELRLKKWQTLVERMVRRGLLRKEHRIRGPQVKPKTESLVVLSAAPADETIASLSKAPKQRAVLTFLRQLVEEKEGLLPLTISPSELAAQAGVTPATVATLVRRGLLTLSQREVRRDPLAGREFVTTEPPRFTPDQEAAWQPLASALESTRGQVFLLHGVTGSGKTEIYLRALAEVLRAGGQGIVLVPEIALTPQTIRRFAARFPGRVAVLHSRLSAGERYDEWRRIRAGQADVVIGPRSAIFSPLPRLSLIVVDEEHEWTYKQQEMPCYHARDVAVKLAALTGALVILGSATPDVNSYHRAIRGEFHLLKLPQRIMAHQGSVQMQQQEFHLGNRPAQLKPLGPGYEDARFLDLPPVEVVDLRAELRAGNRSIFSRSLQQAMYVALAAGEQVMLFINRRGTATVVMCRDCGHVVKCRGCDTAMTYHGETGKLLCHYCNYERSVPKVCPECSSQRIRFFGIGTQKVAEVVRELFPQARTLRWDRDVTGGKDAHERILDQFVRHEADVLIGTQMIAKGLDLPLVTLVGVVSADTALHLPDFRASERTFQLLTQVAGRAGRSILGGKVVIQTYTPQHFSIQAASRHDYEGFYGQELEFRRQHGYPPFGRLLRLLFTDVSARKCQVEVDRLYNLLQATLRGQAIASTDLIGPAPCFTPRIAGRYRWQIVIRGPQPTELLRHLSLPPGWHIDVDPVSLL